MPTIGKIRSVKSTKSIRSVKAISDFIEEHVDIADVIVTAVNKFECPITVVVCTDSLPEIHSKLKTGSRNKKHKSLTPMVSNVEPEVDEVSSAKTEKQAEAQSDEVENTLTITAIHDSNNRLVEIAINKYQLQEIPRVIIQVLGVILPSYTKLTNFTIRDCRIDKYTIYELNNLLKASSLTDICLDSSFLPEANYDILLQQATSLRHLSLKTCKINDDVCERIASHLHFLQPAERFLLALNLSSNHITDVGAKAIGKALRNNRHLRYLNLSDNQITDDGARYIFEVLKEFPLTYEEIMSKRERYMKYVKNKLTIYNRCLQELDRNKSTSDSISRKSVKKKRTSAVSLKSKSSDRKDRRSLNAIDDFVNDKAELMAMELIGPFIYPFNNAQVLVKDGYSYCIGNMVLCYLNLAYNDLAFPSLHKLLDVLEFQRQRRNDDLCGLMKVVLDGNHLPESCVEIDCLNETFQRLTRSFQGGKSEKPTQGRKSIIRSSP